MAIFIAEVAARGLDFSAITCITSPNLVFRWLGPLPALRFETPVFLAIQNRHQRQKLPLTLHETFSTMLENTGGYQFVSG